MEPILLVKGLRTEFSTPRGVVRATDGVELEVRKGEVVGLVGESGCGKTVTALSIMYLIPDPPGRIAGGEIWFRGINLLVGTEQEIVARRDDRGRTKVVRRERLIRKHRDRMNKVRGREISMIFQEPMSSLNPVLPVGYQIAEVLMYQRAREISDAVLSRGEPSPQDLEAFGRAASLADPRKRREVLAEFCAKTGLPLTRVTEILEQTGTPLDERVRRVARLARRRRVRNRWFARLLKKLDAVESDLIAREWRRLSGKAPPEGESGRLGLEAQYRSGRALYRLATSIPVVRRLLMRPIEREAERRVHDLLRMVRIPEPGKVYRAYPHELSGGMQQRIMIAMALACEPALVIADEPTTSLDVTTQAQILKLLEDLRSRLDSAILYITHDLAVVAELCDRVAVMYAGKIVEDAPAEELFAGPKHPYTQGLLESIVSVDKPVSWDTPLPTIPGTVPDLLHPPLGCRFHPRCKYAFDRCSKEEPRLLPAAPGHKVACFLYQAPEDGHARAP